MAHTSNWFRRNGAKLHGSFDDPYCSFKSDRERCRALISRNVRIFGCRLVTVVGVFGIAILAPPGIMVGFLARVLGRL